MYMRRQREKKIKSTSTDVVKEGASKDTKPKEE